MSNLNFTSSEVRIATATLASLAALIPAAYWLLPSKPQESTQHVRTFRKFIKAYSTLRPAALVTNADRDFTHVALPSSLGIPTRTIEPFKQHAAMIFSLFAEFQMIPQGAVHFSEETNTVIAHCKMGGKINGDSDNGKKLIDSGLQEWWTECVLMVRMDERGQRVVEVREFVHSAKAEELKKRIMGVFEDRLDN